MNLSGIEGEGEFSCGGKIYKVKLNIVEKELGSLGSQENSFSIDPMIMDIIKTVFKNYTESNEKEITDPISKENLLELYLNSLNKVQDLNETNKTDITNKFNILTKALDGLSNNKPSDVINKFKDEFLTFIKCTNTNNVSDITDAISSISEMIQNIQK